MKTTVAYSEIRNSLIEYFGASNDAMEVAEDVWNVYYPNSIAKPTTTIWLYDEKVSGTNQRTYEFSINNDLHVYSTKL